MFKNTKYLILAAALIFSLVLPDIASASSLNQAGVRLGRLGTNSSTADGNDLFVSFKLKSAPTTVTKITVTFPTGFTIITGTPTVGAPPTGYTLPPGITAGTSTATVTAASKTIVLSGLTSASLDAVTLYGFTLPTGSITNPAATGQYNVTVESDAGASVVDLTTTPVFITTANTADQIAVSASVAPNFSFSLSANADTVPPVDPTTIQTSPVGVNMTVGTNSPLGYTAYVKSKNAALNSPTQVATPIATGAFDGTPDTMTAGTTKYGFVPTTGTACSSCTGTLAYAPEYLITDGTHAGSFNAATTFAPFVSRSAGYTNADVINLKERVTVANTVAYANDYADTLTIVAAGNF